MFPCFKIWCMNELWVWYPWCCRTSMCYFPICVAAKTKQLPCDNVQLVQLTNEKCGRSLKIILLFKEIVYVIGMHRWKIFSRFQMKWIFRITKKFFYFTLTVLELHSNPHVFILNDFSQFSPMLICMYRNLRKVFNNYSVDIVCLSMKRLNYNYGVPWSDQQFLDRMIWKL